MNKKLLLSLCSGLIFTMVGCNSSVSSQAKDYSYCSSVVKSNYEYYENFTVPTYTFDNGTNSKTVKGVIVFPNGTSVCSDSVTLSNYGHYVIKYSSTLAGKNVYHEESFDVTKKLIEFNNHNSTKVMVNSLPSYAQAYTSTTGTYIDLAKGDELTFNQAIDVASLTKDTQIIKGFVSPLVSGEFDFSQLNFIMTDISDPSVKVTVTLNGYASSELYGYVSYFKAAGENQIPSGKSSETQAFKINSNGIFGTKVIAPFNGNVNGNKDPSNYPFSFTYNDLTKIIYGCNTLVADLDNSAYFTSVWTGFPSGKVYLSIKGGSYLKSVGRFCLTDVYGIDLNEEYIIDKEGPEISVDFEGDTPIGEVGKYYSIPKATAYETSEHCNKRVDTNVYYNYNSNKPVNVNVEDGKFLPTKPGYYAIVYTSTDSFNNLSKEILWVKVNVSNQEISAVIPASILSSYPVGTKIAIPTLEDVQGGAGSYQIKVYMGQNNQYEEIENGMYMPLRTGTYTLLYEVVDYIGVKKQFTKTIEITDSTSIAYEDVIGLEETYLSHYQYDLPSLTCYTFENGVGQKHECKVTILTLGTGVITNKKFTITPTTNLEKVTFKFSYNETTVLEKEATVILTRNSDGNLTFNNYFSSDNQILATIPQGEYSGVKIKNLTNNASWKFASRVIGKIASVKYSKLLKNSFTKLSTSLTDYKDPSSKITISLYSEGYLTVGGDSFHYQVELNETEENNLEFAIKDNYLIVGQSSILIKFYDNGNSFNGFPNYFVDIEGNCTGGLNKTYNIAAISKCPLHAYEDTVEPEFAFTDVHGGQYEVGQVYKAPGIVFGDLASQQATCTLTCKFTESGTNTKSDVYDINGVKLTNVDPTKDYYISLEKYGKFVFTYNLNDPNENPLSSSYAVTTVDKEAPEIILTSSYKATAKVGDTLVMPNFKVKDNTTKSEDITIIAVVSNPQGFEILLSKTIAAYDENHEVVEVRVQCNSLKAECVGTYTFRIVAIDSQGNSTMKYFPVEVK